MGQWYRQFRQTTERRTARTTVEALAVPSDKLTYSCYHITYLHFYNNHLELRRVTCVVAHPEGTKHTVWQCNLSCSHWNSAEGTHHSSPLQLGLQKKVHLEENKVNEDGKECQPSSCSKTGVLYSGFIVKHEESRH